MKRQLPIDGQIRHVLVFPILPIVCNSQEAIWLEWAVIEQRYTYGHNGVSKGWENTHIAKDGSFSCVKRIGIIALLFGKP